MKISNHIKLIIFSLLCIAITSCTYEKIEEETGLPENMSFKDNIIPMFTANCSSVGCHNDGGISPDLSPANAFVEITTISGMVDVANPEESELYKRMIDVAKPMPMSGVLSYESSQLLSWIKDGAKDN